MSFMSSEQLLSEIVFKMSEEYGMEDITKLQTHLSSVLINYEIKRLENAEEHYDLKHKIEIFKSAKRLEGVSKETIRNYNVELGLFSRYINKKVEDISSSDIRFFLSQFPNCKMSTIGKKLSVLKSFFVWLTSEEIIQRDPSKKVKVPKVEKRLPKSLTVEELEMLRESCDTVRLRCMFELYYATGARLSELADLNTSDIDFNSKSFKVIGKGNKERLVFFNHKSLYHLKKYLNSREDSESALFVTERKPYRRLSTRGIQREFKRLAKIAKFNNPKLSLSPKLMRSSFATLTLNHGADISAVQSLLGHTNSSTTEFYCRISEERKREQYNKHHVQ